MDIRLKVYTSLSFLLLLALMSCKPEKDIHEADCDFIYFNDALYEEGPVDETIHIIQAELEDDCLKIELNYSGGCDDHVLKLAGRGWIKTYPPQVDLKIIHDNQDPCDAVVEDKLYFDVENLRYEDSKEIIINLEGWDETLTHIFED